MKRFAFKDMFAFCRQSCFGYTTVIRLVAFPIDLLMLLLLMLLTLPETPVTTHKASRKYRAQVYRLLANRSSIEAAEPVGIIRVSHL